MRTLYDLDKGVPGVRLAEKKDEAQIFQLLLMLHKENGMFGLNPDKVMSGIRWATDRHGGVIYVIDDQNVIAATLGMLITSDWYSDDEYLLERWNFVHPNYRHTNYGRMLIEQAKWAHHWFKRQGLLLPFQCGINSFDRTEAKVRLYARHMPCIGAYFMYGIPPLQQGKAVQEALQIEKLNKDNRQKPRSEQKVRPVVETIIRVSQREPADV